MLGGGGFSLKSETHFSPQVVYTDLQIWGILFFFLCVFFEDSALKVIWHECSRKMHGGRVIILARCQQGRGDQAQPTVVRSCPTQASTLRISLICCPGIFSGAGPLDAAVPVRSTCGRMFVAPGIVNDMSSLWGSDRSRASRSMHWYPTEMTSEAVRNCSPDTPETHGFRLHSTKLRQRPALMFIWPRDAAWAQRESHTSLC